MSWSSVKSSVITYAAGAFLLTLASGCGGFQSLLEESVLSSEFSSDLAAEAAEVLLVSCSNCHSDAAKSGGVGQLLSAQKLIDARMVVPGSPENSSLYQSVALGRMPLGAPLDEHRKSILAEWIRRGAKEFPPLESLSKEVAVIQPAELMTSILEDISQVAESDRPFVRYLTLDHVLKNKDLPDVQKEIFPQAVAKVINSLHYRNQMSLPYALKGSAGAVYRIHLQEIDFPVERWESMVASADPYTAEHESLTSFQEIKNLTATEAPVVRADWFIRKVTQPEEYRQILALPDNVAELEGRLGVDVEENIRTNNVVRLGVRRSRVSFSNRVIERHLSPFGVYWKSYDFASSLGKANIFDNPLGPVSTGSDKAFAHDGGEMIFSLPNGLHGYMVTNAEGVHLNAGPAEIVRDGSREDQIVTNSTSCFTCHAAGIIQTQDNTRDYVSRLPGLFSAPHLNVIYAQYPVAEQIQQAFQADDTTYKKALSALGINSTHTEPISTATIHYDRALSLNTLASELHKSPEELSRLMEQDETLKALLLDDEKLLTRNLFEERFVDILEQLK